MADQGYFPTKEVCSPNQIILQLCFITKIMISIKQIFLTNLGQFGMKGRVILAHPALDKASLAKVMNAMSKI